MPLIYEGKHCPGTDRKCRWSTNLQKTREIITDDMVACQICLAHSGGSWTLMELALQLAQLHTLDPDLYFAAIDPAKMPREVFKKVKTHMISIITSSVPESPRMRENQRCEMVRLTLKYLTTTSWVIDCWDRRIKEDNIDIAHIKLAMCTLPETTRGLVLDFLCGDLVSFYMHLCTVKTHAYHTMERPLFWYPDNGYSLLKRNRARNILANVYQHVIDTYHKPKLMRIQKSLIKHSKFIKPNKTMRRRYKECMRIMHLVKAMLQHDAIIVK